MEYRPEALTSLLACLKALALQHHHAHVVSKGACSFSDHLLFERLYDITLEHVDSLSERIVGLDRYEIELPVLMVAMQDVINTWAQYADKGYVRQSLEGEKTLLHMLEMVRQKLESKGLLTLGLEDLLGRLASTHEEHCYLLKQRLS